MQNYDDHNFETNYPQYNSSKNPQNKFSDEIFEPNKFSNQEDSDIKEHINEESNESNNLIFKKGKKPLFNRNFEKNIEDSNEINNENQEMLNEKSHNNELFMNNKNKENDNIFEEINDDQYEPDFNNENDDEEDIAQRKYTGHDEFNDRNNQEVFDFGGNQYPIDQLQNEKKKNLIGMMTSSSEFTSDRNPMHVIFYLSFIILIFYFIKFF